MPGEWPEGSPQSPLPERSFAQQRSLAKHLVSLPTLAARIAYLADHHSVCYRRADGSAETDPSVIASSTDLKAVQLKGPTISRWVAAHSGTNFSKVHFYYLRDGERVAPGRPVLRALAAFWRLDERVLDVSVPADWLDDDSLNREGKKLLAAMNEVGVTEIKAKDVERLTDGVSPASRRQLLEVLRGIADEQRASRDRRRRRKPETGHR